MTIEESIHLGQRALATALLLGGPMLMVALVVGTVVSILQSVTQVQEMTLVFVPKMISVFVVLALTGAWMLQVSVTFGVEMFNSIGAG